MNVEYSTEDKLHEQEVVALYKANKWSSAEKPQALLAALANSHSVVTARVEGKLVGLGNAISDGHLVVYYPHLLVDPEFQRQGIGKEMMRRLQKRYAHFHQQMLTADVDAVAFYQSIGFSRAGRTAPMWIYQGDEH
ncbi:MAG: GNAT family N-acetyltransferase [Verrucomicrobiota bacterium]